MPVLTELPYKEHIQPNRKFTKNELEDISIKTHNLREYLL
jgi:hypothetical protein